MLRLSSNFYSHAYILPKRVITITRAEGAGDAATRQASNRQKR